MRPKLVHNYGFDPHSEASSLRDNEGGVASDEAGGGADMPSLIPVAKEAIKDDIGDDRLGDEEWNLISGGPRQVLIVCLCL